MARSSAVDKKPSSSEPKERGDKRPISLWLALFVLLLNGTWAIYHLQFESLPVPQNVEQAGKRGFSEVSALEHVKYLTGLGPHPIGSDALDLAVQYVMEASEKIKKTAHWEVDVQVDLFHAKTGANRLVTGLFKGKTLIYSDLKHVVLRILPKYLPEAEENSILVSSHIDTVFSTEGAGDCSSCVGVMLELARGISQWAHGFKNGVIFLFNTGEEEGLNGAHSFITQDLFISGAIKSATDFQIYKEVAGLPGLDFAYMDASAVYHTKNDKLKLLKPGSLQHLGENMLAFLLQTATSSSLHKEVELNQEGSSQSHTIFFDVLGMYMVVYSQRLAKMLHNSVILQALLIWTTSLLMGGFSGVASFGLSFFSILMMWTFSLSLSALVAFILPLVCSSPVPYIANPWLVVGLFGGPAVFGALAGQHIGFLLLRRHLQRTFSKQEPRLSPTVQEDLVKWEAERWLFKSGFIQWLIILIVCNFFKVGSSYLALVWLVSPAFAYGFLEATLTPIRLPKQLKIVTLVLGLAVPVLVSSGMIIRLVGILTGIMVRFDRNAGSTPEWLGSLMLAVFVASTVCLTLVYLLSYMHLSGAKRSIILSICALFAFTILAVSTGVIPAFTEDFARAVDVVHVVESTGRYEDNQDPLSYVSLFSSTPGKLIHEVQSLKDEEFSCGKNKTLDFVTFTVKYGCYSSKNSGEGWTKLDVPIIHVESDSITDSRKTRVLIDAKHSTRWALAINIEEIRDFTVEANSEVLVPEDEKVGVDGWHIIQFSGGKSSPTKFHLNLFWSSAQPKQKTGKQAKETPLLLKLRTDLNKITPQTSRVLEKLPPWCSLFGKSTSPHTLAFLTSLPVNF